MQWKVVVSDELLQAQTKTTGNKDDDAILCTSFPNIKVNVSIS